MWRSHDSRVLIEPRRGRNETSLPSKALMIIVPEDLKEFVSILNCSYLRELFLSRIYRCESNEELCIVGPLIGAPQAVMVVEKLVALGVREIVALGWCGSLRDEIVIGDVVIPDKAFSEEGTSRHYFSGYEIASSSLPPCFSLITDALNTRGLRLHRGKIWSTDAPYRETVEKVLLYQGREALAVDMETSALFSVARFRGIYLGILLVVSDSLSTLKWKSGSRSPEFLKTRKIILEVFRNLVQKS